MQVSVVLHTTGAIPLGVSSGYEVGWAPEVARTLWRIEASPYWESKANSSAIQPIA
jgi:hypothetical protein